MKKIKWHKVAAFENEIFFQQNGIAVVDVNAKKICLTKFGERLYAFAFKCPHAGGIMADGFIDAVGNVVCPLHRYKYSIMNGRNTSGEGFYLKTWPAEQREDGIYIGIEESGLFSWR
jgi:3-phenylpropionate/trans-cinnamate dioxygenase ferredoxin subunit